MRTVDRTDAVYSCGERAVFMVKSVCHGVNRESYQRLAAWQKTK